MRVFSGVQPTGELHIGNYFGAIRQFVALQQRAECLFCVVDLHALTLPHDPEALRRETLLVAASYLACGIDPDRAIVFVQSQVPAHSELSWILGCLAGFGELGRMTQFKDKSQKAESVSLGLFSYPVLMASDILLYRATAVPVGDDQKQHLELCRDLAERFNARFGTTFPVPEPLISQSGARVMSLQDPSRKMSKSDPDPASRIGLVDPPDVIRRKIRRAVTDTGREVRYDPEGKPAISNLLEIFSLCAGEAIPDLERRYGDQGYAGFKADLAEAIIGILEPIQNRLAEYQGDQGQVLAALRRGQQAAADMASPALSAVRQRVGLLDPTHGPLAGW